MTTTNYELSIENAVWVDSNPQFTKDPLPDRIPNILAIKGSLYNLFNCPIGARARIFQPEYGSEWHHYLQEPVDEITAAKMRITMFQAIARWEPRIIIDYEKTSVIAIPSLPGYKVTIVGLEATTGSVLTARFMESL